MSNNTYQALNIPPAANERGGFEVLRCAIIEGELHLPTREGGLHGCRASIRHMNHVYAGHHLEQLAGHMGPGADAWRRHVELAGIGLGVRDQLRNRFGRDRRMQTMTMTLRLIAATGAMSRMKLKLSLS